MCENKNKCIATDCYDLLIDEDVCKRCSHPKLPLYCVLCNKEVPKYWDEYRYESNRSLCDDCLIKNRDKEKKTYGWLVYHLLGLEKRYGRFIIKNKKTTKNKYGLQQIFVNCIRNTVTFTFYYGRSFIHRPSYIIPLKNIEKNKDLILNAIEKNTQTDIKELLKIRGVIKKNGY